jgi:hypothetical protein
MRFVYDFNEGNVRAASRKYNVDIPRAIQQPRFYNGTPQSEGNSNVQSEENVLDAVHANPLTSTRRITYSLKQVSL